MTISVVLRLVDRAVASGRLAGEAQLVRSGERTEIQNADELLAFVQRVGEQPRVEIPEQARRRQ
jgi:hypothetical protein